MSEADDCRDQVNLERIGYPVIVQTDAGTLATVHAWLCVAMRHPDAGLRPSIEVAAKFARSILGACIAAGLFTPEALCRIANDPETDPRALPEALLRMRKGGQA